MATRSLEKPISYDKLHLPSSHLFQLFGFLTLEPDPLPPPLDVIPWKRKEAYEMKPVKRERVCMD